MLQKPVRRGIGFAVCVLLSAMILPELSYAGEPPGPGPYAGTYHIDRWGRHRFIGSELAVSPKLAKKLKPFIGLPTMIRVTRMGDHPTHPVTKGMMTAIGTVKLRPAVVGLDIEWDMGAKGKPPRMLRVKEGRNVKIRITIVNLTAQPISLDKASLSLGFDRIRPSGTGRTDPLDYWPGFHFRCFSIQPEQQRLDVFAKRVPAIPRAKPEDVKAIAPGKARIWTVTVANLPANEYEVRFRHVHYRRDKKDYVYILSKALRLDVLTDKPKSWSGLSVRLENDRGRKPGKKNAIPMRVRFTNTGKKPLRFVLPKKGPKWDVTDYVYCYDNDGTQISPAPKSFLDSTPIGELVLQPGKDLFVPVDLPAKTRMARVAFVRLWTPHPKERVLGYGYVFSRHVLLPAKKK